MSAGEALLAWQLEQAAIDHVREHRFHPERRWRFDFALPAFCIAIEVEGGVWTRGRHVRGRGFAADAEKYNEAAILGWRVLRVTPEMVEDGRALRWIEHAIEGAP